MVMEKLIRRFNTSPSSKKKLSGSAWPEVVSAQMDAPSATSFGVSLADLYEKETLGVPMVVRQLCAFLCAVGGLECEGVFRVNGNSRVVEQLRARAEELQHAANGESAKTTTFLDELQRQNDVHAAASLLKMFLRELPGGLVPSAITKEVLAAYGCHETDTALLVSNVKHLLSRLPVPNFLLLQFLCCFLNQVVRSESRNKMSATAIGIVFGPSVFRCPKQTEVYSTQGTVNNIMSLLVEHADDFFDPRALEEARLPLADARVLKLQKTVGHMGAQGNHNYARRSVDSLVSLSAKPQPRPRASVQSPVRDSKLHRNDWSSPEREALTPALEMCNSCGYGTGDAESAPLSPTLSDLPTARSGGDDELSPGLQNSLQFCIWQHAIGRLPPAVPALSKQVGLCQPKPYKPFNREQTQEDEQHQSTRSDPLRIPSPSKAINHPVSYEKRPSHLSKLGRSKEYPPDGVDYTADQSTHIKQTNVYQVKQTSRPEPRRMPYPDGQLEAVKRTSSQDGDKFSPQRASSFLFIGEIHDLGDSDLPGPRHGTTDRGPVAQPLPTSLQTGTVPRRSSPAVVDSTGHNPAGGPNLAALSLEDSFSFLVDRLSRKREQANRPIRVAEMTVREVEAEKLALQKALLSFENAHGRPTGHQERLTMRPLYDRYRIMKRVLAAIACATAATTNSGSSSLEDENPLVSEVARRLPNTLGPILAESEEPSADIYAVAAVRQQQQHQQPFSLQRRLISASRPAAAAPASVKKPSEVSAATANSQTVSLHSDHNIDQVERYLAQAPEEDDDEDRGRTVNARDDGVGAVSRDLTAGAPSVLLIGSGNSEWFGPIGLSASRSASQSVGASAEPQPTAYGSSPAGAGSSSAMRAARDAQLHSLESQSLSSLHTLGDGLPAPEVLCRLTSVDDSDFHVLDFIRAGAQPMPAVKITQPLRPFLVETTGGDSSMNPVTASAGSPLRLVAPSKLPHRSPGDLPKAILDLKADDDFTSRYSAMSMMELNTEVKNIREMKRFLQKILKDFEHDFERKQGRKLEFEDRMPMQVEYNRYKLLKLRLSTLEQLIDSKSTGV
uniref:Rho-GAP domain-containing protein n=1 Tax=Schistocephalus solidus TaxID=70667 RepID=A0A0X3PSN0_SCHSO